MNMVAVGDRGLPSSHCHSEKPGLPLLFPQRRRGHLLGPIPFGPTPVLHPLRHRWPVLFGDFTDTAGLSDFLSKILLCTGLMTLILMSLGIETGHAAVDPILPECLFKQGVFPSEHADGPDKARIFSPKTEEWSRERAAAAEAAARRETEKQGDNYLARAQIAIYAGQFTEAFSQYQRAAKISPPSTSELLNEMGRAGKYPGARPYLTQALQQREQDLNPGHPDVAISLNNLAELYRAQGKYVEAEPLYQRVIAIFETALGPEHPNVAPALNNLARLYQTQGKYAKAEPLYQRALRIDETALGPNHPDVAIDLNNLAEFYRDKGKYAEAEPLFQQALRIREAALDATHPDVGQSLNNLAELYRALGKYAEAELLYRRALSITRAALGPQHPLVAIRLNNLALLLKIQGKYTEAEPLYQRALRIDEAALGPNHPDLAIRLKNLANLYRDQGKYTKAEPLFQRSFWIFHKNLGPDHPTVHQAFSTYQAFLKASRQPHTENGTWEKLRSSVYSLTSMTHSP